MPRGASDIPILRLEVIQGFMETFMKPPNLFFVNQFGSQNTVSDSIKWESQRGGRAMTPFIPPGSPSEVTAPHGVAEHRAAPAFWGEKMFFDEVFLNNLRKPGTTMEHQGAEEKLAKELSLLSNRSNRRKEWMFAKMLFDNGFSYDVKGGYKATVSYGIPSDHRVTLGSAYNWNDGGSKNILSDIQDGKRKIQEDCGGKVNVAMCTSYVLKYLANDTTLRQLLQANYFGPGLGNPYTGSLHDIIGVNPGVIAKLLDIDNLIIYDEMYEVRAWLTAAVTGGSTTWITVDDNHDFVAGEKIRFWDVSAGTYEDTYIIDVQTETNKVQLSAPPASSYKAGEDYVTMAKYFVPNDKFLMMATEVDGQPIASYMQAPFGLNRNYGQKTDRHEQWDPDGVWVRVQDKGLPVLYNRDAVYVLDVVAIHPVAGKALTSTTTSSSSTTTTTTAGA